MQRVNGRARRVIILADTTVGSHRRIVEGVARFLRSGIDWDPTVLVPQGTANPQTYLDHADGVLTVFSLSEMAPGRPLPPAVAVGVQIEGLPCVAPDEQMTGRLAGEHFLELGLRHFAFCGMDAASFSNERKRGFEHWAASQYAQVHAYGHPLYVGMEQHAHEMEPLAAWLAKLPKPIGIFHVTTQSAHVFTHLARLLGYRIPEQFAVLGVDEDDLMAEMSRPRLSMVDAAADTMGYQAAALLEEMLNGRTPPEKPVLVPPRRVIPAESTGLIYTESATLADAMQLIRKQACSGIGVMDVVRQTRLGRRALEKRFRAEFGMTIHDAIVGERIRMAKQLLEYTDLPVEAIALKAGFGSSSMLSATFRRLAGVSPREYRQAIVSS